MGFVRKVYGILSVQLLVTAFITMLPFTSDGVREFVQTNQPVAILAIIINVVVLIVLSCNIEQARTVPNNYILLFTFTIAEAYTVAVICSEFDPDVVIAAVFMTAGVTSALTIYAWTARTDFTIFGGMIVVVGMAFCMAGLFLILLQGDTLNMIFCALGVILYGLYLIIDTQMIIGDRGYKITEDDYVIAALILYLDIIMMFIYILRIIDRMKNK